MHLRGGRLVDNDRRMADPIDIFICYAGPDKGTALRVRRMLKAAGLNPWCDAADLLPDDPWDRVIPGVLQRARAVVVLITPGWPIVGEENESYYGPEEVAIAIGRAREIGTSLVPVRLDGIGPARVPYGLRRFTGIDARSSRLDPIVDGLRRVLARQAGAPVAEAASDPLEEAQHRRDARAQAGAPPEALAALDARILAIKRGRLHTRKPAQGLTLSDRWDLESQLGRGGFAEVWKAWDDHTGEWVAVKLLHAQHDDSAERRARFFRGARQMARIEHPAIVRVIEPEGEHGGWHFFVMEYMPGGDLAAAVRESRITRVGALVAVVTVADGLAAAHGRGLVHRDVKPANILLDGAGRAKLSDFDLVRANDTTGGTRTAALGSFLYAAPEAQENAQRVTERCDVYGLGMSALFALVGQPLRQIVLREPKRAMVGVEGFAAVKREILKAIDWEPDARHESAAAFAAALRRAMALPPPPRRPRAPKPPPILRPRARSPIVAIEPPPRLSPIPGTVIAEETAHRPALVYIPPGRFMMGSPKSEEGRDADERLHPVVLSGPLLMARTPVTERQYRALMDKTSRGTAQPITRVSWHDAVAFCNTLSKREGLTQALRGAGDAIEVVPGADGYRLPTEAEWAYACRAGTTTRFWSGDGEADLARVGWYAGNSGGGTLPVGQKQANPWGLHDMHGNAWEWCHDWYGGYPDPPPGGAPLVGPAGPPHGANRVMRGGAYGVHAHWARSAYRSWWRPGGRSRRVGFRLVRAPRAP